MHFSIDIQSEDVFPIIVLKDERCETKVVIYAFGALLNNFIIDGKQDIIDAFQSGGDAKENITNGFKSCKLSPFVCRLKNGEYSYNYKQYKTGKFFRNKEAIHGLLCDSTFTIKNSGADDEAAFITLETFYANKNEGFPFGYSCKVTYQLEPQNKLSVITIITNHSNQQIPVCDGWHPYFKFDQPISNLSFRINANKILEFDESLIPTGKLLSFSDFQTLKKLNDVAFDNCFLLNDSQHIACSIVDKQHLLKLDILPSEAYPYLQVFTPEDRNSIAIENLSAAPDAFNNKMGLVILKPAESKTFTTIFQAQYF